MVKWMNSMDGYQSGSKIMSESFIVAYQYAKYCVLKKLVVCVCVKTLVMVLKI